jgi:hypothetical protein
MKDILCPAAILLALLVPGCGNTEPVDPPKVESSAPPVTPGTEPPHMIGD